MNPGQERYNSDTKEKIAQDYTNSLALEIEVSRVGSHSYSHNCEITFRRSAANLSQSGD